jgi:imidazolonepropionase-like amidohydrolase
MRLKLLVCGVAALLTNAASAQTPVAELARPPADAKRWVIQSTAGPHGESWRWITADGTRMARESMNLRGQVWEMDFAGKPGPSGTPASAVVRGVTPQGDAAESFAVTGGTATWKSPVDGGSVALATPAFYYNFGGPIESVAWLIESILSTTDHSLALLPGGRARAERLTSVEVGDGASRQTVTAWAVTGIATSPIPVWTDANNKFFSLVFIIGWVPEVYAGEQAKLEAAQTAALAARAPAQARSLARTPTVPVAFTGVRVFDAEGRRFRADQTVVVDKGKITASGASSSVRVPAGAEIIDGRGKTLLPGLWDSHMHVGDDTTGLQELSMGVTSVRDPGNNDALTIDRRTRAGRGELLFPNVFSSSLIDGKGKYAAQVANIATSEAEAVARVAEAKANGFHGVKFYGTLNPAWLPAAIAEARRLGLHVHGHVPAGIRPMDAINAGYNEITHINWIMMQAMPDSVIAESNGILRFEGPGRFARDVDLDGAAIDGIVRAMARRGIYSDPTMVAFESLYVPENGDLSPSYGAFAGTIPPSTERAFRAGGFAVPKDLNRAHYRASWAKMVGLLGKMHRAGVPIVAGTDGAGIELVRELEIYTEAGMSPAEALATATIVPARLVGADGRKGSIKVGKDADLVLVEGDPSARIGDLRQTRIVMLGEKLLDADALRTAAGFSGRPK